MNKIIVEVSIGELLDKISILEIKQEKIKDPEKLKFINNEHSVLINFNLLGSLIFSCLISKIEILSKSSPTETSTIILFIKFNTVLSCYKYV